MAAKVSRATIIGAAITCGATAENVDHPILNHGGGVHRSWMNVSRGFYDSPCTASATKGQRGSIEVERVDDVRWQWNGITMSTPNDDVVPIEGLNDETAAAEEWRS